MKSEQGFRWLLGEIPNLLAERIMDPAQAEALTQYCQNQLAEKVDKTQKLALSIFAVFGVLLLCGGTILFFNYNWDTMSLGARLAVSFLPLAVGIGLGGFTLWKRNHFAWREISAVVTACGIAVSWALVSQIYQLDGSLREFLFGVLVLSFGLIVVFDSALLEILYIIGLYPIIADFEKPEIKFLILEVLILCRVMRRIWNHNPPNRIFGYYLLLLLFPVLLIGFGFQQEWLISSYTAFLLLGFAIGWIHHDDTGDKGYCNPLFPLGWIALNLFWMVANLTFDDFFFTHYSFLSLFSRSASLWSMWLLIAVTLAAAPVVRLCKQRNIAWSLAGILAGIPLLLWGIAIPYVLIAYQILFGIMLTLKGMKHKDMTLFAMGILTFFCLALTKFFSSEMDILLRAAGFSACGIAMLTADCYFYRYCRRSENSRKEVA